MLDNRLVVRLVYRLNKVGRCLASRCREQSGAVVCHLYITLLLCNHHSMVQPLIPLQRTGLAFNRVRD